MTIHPTNIYICFFIYHNFTGKARTIAEGRCDNHYPRGPEFFARIRVHAILGLSAIAAISLLQDLIYDYRRYYVVHIRTIKSIASLQ